MLRLRRTDFFVKINFMLEKEGVPTALTGEKLREWVNNYSEAYRERFTAVYWLAYDLRLEEKFSLVAWMNLFEKSNDLEEFREIVSMFCSRLLNEANARQIADSVKFLTKLYVNFRNNKELGRASAISLALLHLFEANENLNENLAKLEPFKGEDLNIDSIFEIDYEDLKKCEMLMKDIFG